MINLYHSHLVTLFRVFRASCAALRAGSAFVKSSSQSFCFLLTSSAISPTLYSSSSAVKFNNTNNYLYLHVHIYLSAVKLSTPTKYQNEGKRPLMSGVCSAFSQKKVLVFSCNGRGVDTFKVFSKTYHHSTQK